MFQLDGSRCGRRVRTIRKPDLIEAEEIGRETVAPIPHTANAESAQILTAASPCGFVTRHETGLSTIHRFQPSTIDTSERRSLRRPIAFPLAFSVGG